MNGNSGGEMIAKTANILAAGGTIFRGSKWLLK
jgi:hypothetical protein